ncbi:MAG: DHH family phosphoesterase, partial [Peptoniphilaceae bacterium]|nr:DHH family phosphoesterase [Peptoniphilaceae bacterium]MDY5765945.1 DHH family phosphoesterase [Peptoniphilaceae bacterium]
MDWFIEQKRKTIKALMDTGEFSPLEAILLGNRGIATPKDANEYYHATMEDTPDPFLFQGMEIAVQYILECLESEIPIRICGDYDQDGVTATVILMRGIRHFARKLGLDADTAVSYAIPDRMEDGYGINRNMVDQAIRDGCGLIITCDNGIAAFDAL